MTPARFESLRDGINGVARRVLEATPKAEPWTASEIHQELARTDTGARDFRLTQGSLARLVQTGLVKEQRGRFVQVRVRQRLVGQNAANDPINETEPEITTVPQLQPTAAAPARQEPPLDKLVRLASELRADIATRLAEIDSVVLEVLEEQSRQQGEVEKLRELRRLLGSI